MAKEKSDFEDLVDFYNQWPTLRDQLMPLTAGDTLSDEQARILQLLFHVVDCVGPQDLVRDPPAGG